MHRIYGQLPGHVQLARLPPERRTYTGGANLGSAARKRDDVSLDVPFLLPLQTLQARTLGSFRPEVYRPEACRSFQAWVYRSF